jgi:hypothetical protein
VHLSSLDFSVVHICSVTTLRIPPLSRSSVEKAPHRLLSLSSFFFARSLRAYVIRGPILQDQDWTVQSRDENLDTIATILQIHQTLVFTSDRHLSVAQRFGLFTSIVNVGCGLVSGSNSTALPPLRRQRLRQDNSSNRSCLAIDSSSVLSADLFTSGVVLSLVGSLQPYSPCAVTSCDATLVRNLVNVNITRFALVGRGLLPGTISTALPSLPTQVSRLRHCSIRTSAAESLHLCGFTLVEVLHLCG